VSAPLHKKRPAAEAEGRFDVKKGASESSRSLAHDMSADKRKI
jgi:hypothetical protein